LVGGRGSGSGSGIMPLPLPRVVKTELWAEKALPPLTTTRRTPTVEEVATTALSTVMSTLSPRV